MKQFLYNAFFLLSTLTSIRCTESSNTMEDQHPQIHSAVINRFNAMIKYAEAGELENVLMHFDASGPGTYIENGVPYTTLEDMLVHYRATWKIQKQDYGVPLTKVYVLSPESAFVISSATLNTTHRDGVIFQPRPWSLSTLWTLKDGEWFIHTFHQYAGELKPVEQEAPPK